jgi:3-phosphoshikimate 1-carboxyvinyltransferase
MPIVNRLSLPQLKLSGTVILEPSKSISNRALIIRSLCKEPFEIHRISGSDDTDALIAMLSTNDDVLYSGHAGSSYRFMVAKACLGDREVTIDASEQLRRRPIGPLVKALQTLGADITYLNKEGFPPLKVKPVKGLGKKVNEVTLQAGISSQYLTALLLIAPVLPKGLTVHLTGEPVSASYIQMTLAMMEYFGVPHQWTDNTIRIEHGAYQAKDYSVEGDWSAASYYYSMAALAEKAEITIEGLKEDSIQGDVVTKDLYAKLGVETTFTENGIVIHKKGIKEKLKEFKYDFSRCPDIAQTLMVTLAGLGIKGILTGLKTLRIKETDRIMAMYTELERVKTKLLVKEEGDNLTVIVVGKAKWKDRAKFQTYEDHRMAMSLVPLACIHPIILKDPEVVSKSYPGFWKDIETIGIKIEKLKMK